MTPPTDWPGPGFAAQRWASRRVRAAGLRGFRVSIAVQLALHANDEGIAWPSVETLAEGAGCCRRTAQSSLHDLETAGVIERLDRKGGRARSGRYRFADAKRDSLERVQLLRPFREAKGATGDRKGAGVAPESQEETGKPDARTRARADTDQRGGRGRGPARLNPEAIIDPKTVREKNARGRAAREKEARDHDALLRKAEALGINVVGMETPEIEHAIRRQRE